MSSFYSTGTVSIDNNGTAVTGSGTAWVTAGVRSGDYLFVVEATGPVPYLITSVESATALTLETKTPYEGTGGSGKSYVIARRWDEEKAADTYRLVNEYVAALNDGTFVASAINDATAKTTPVDADLAALADSAASYALKKLTFANLWAWIATKLKGLAIGSATEPSIAFTGDANTGIYSPGADQVAITTGGAVRAVVDASGNVGMGTSSPGFRLDVQGSAPNTSRINVLRTGSSDIGAQLLSTGLLGGVAASNNGPLAFFTSDAERMRIDPNGIVLIGKSASGAETVGVEFRPTLATMTQNADLVLLLRRNSTDGNIQEFRRDATTVGSISVTTSATAYNTASDRRLPWKAGHTEVGYEDAIERISALMPHYFPVVNRAGFIADEFMAVYPHAVTGEPGAVDDQGNPVMQSMQAGNDALVADLVAVVQNLTQRIAALEAQLGS